MDYQKIIIRAILTEKTYNLLGKGIITFEVPLNATKPQIKEAIEKLYGKKVKKVNTAITRFRKKIIRKAYVRMENPEDAMEIGRMLGIPI